MCVEMALQGTFGILHPTGKTDQLLFCLPNLLNGFDACFANATLRLDKHIADHCADAVADQGLLLSRLIQPGVARFDLVPPALDER